MKRLSLILLFLCLPGLVLAGRWGSQEDLPPSKVQRIQLPDSLRGPSPLSLFGRSLLVPGWGQRVLARSRPEMKNFGRRAFYLDLALITTYVGLTHVATLKENEFQSYAGQRAGASPHGDSSDFWVDLSNYASREAYNDAMMTLGRPHLRYDDLNDDWQWGSTAERARYRDLRAMSSDASSRALAVGGVILLNHVFSGIQALKLAQSPIDLQAVQVNQGIGVAIGFDLESTLSFAKK
jgi:hypothetical protein